MSTLYLTRSNNMIVDVENNTANRLTCCPQRIDDIFLVKEPMHVVYGYGEYSKEFDVEPNDLVITFYGDFKEKAIVVKSEEWAKNIIAYNEAQERQKEEWAAKQPCECADCASCGR